MDKMKVSPIYAASISSFFVCLFTSFAFCMLHYHGALLISNKYSAPKSIFDRIAAIQFICGDGMEAWYVRPKTNTKPSNPMQKKEREIQRKPLRGCNTAMMKESRPSVRSLR